MSLVGTGKSRACADPAIFPDRDPLVVDTLQADRFVRIGKVMVLGMKTYEIADYAVVADLYSARASVKIIGAQACIIPYFQAFSQELQVACAFDNGIPADTHVVTQPDPFDGEGVDISMGADGQVPACAKASPGFYGSAPAYKGDGPALEAATCAA